MSEATFASLNQSLLARKGGAKPAMRPQSGLPIATATAEALEDLGWNDMGSEEPSNVVPISPASNDANDAPVLTLAKKTAAPAKTTAARKSALKRGKRAAFTLRLDAERHLKLRLASTIKGQSAQQIVTDALDSLLNEIKELDALAAQMPQH
ncbi:MAG: hypothetical protein HKM91_08380 [Altererythrobacter sp.]|nr:hypothetical protein [Altererythrobacter sp.]NNF94596.1 hypothetical protein [Altererythrobacter sp.]